MGQAKPSKKLLHHFFETLVFLFVLAVFLFSLYKILTLSGALKPIAYGFSGNPCDHSWCDWEWDWQPWPTKTPTPTPTEPIPAPTLTKPSEPTPTPTTAELTSTPTSSPASGDGGGNGGGGSVSAPVCGAEVPPAPILLRAVRFGENQADLSWTKVEPATHYSLAYGLSPGDYLYGVSNTGNLTAFTVGGLEPATDYCFVVRAVNDCAPSDPSNEICLGHPAGQVLGISTLGDTGNQLDKISWLLLVIGWGCLGARIYALAWRRKA